MTKVRFTSANVNRMLHDVASPAHKLGDEATKYLLGGLHFGNDQGKGTRYIGMGGRMDCQYGPKGARKATAYVWGMGAELGVWERLEALAETSEFPYARIDLDRAKAMANKALGDLGGPEFVTWHMLGAQYVQSMNR